MVEHQVNFLDGREPQYYPETETGEDGWLYCYNNNEKLVVKYPPHIIFSVERQIGGGDTS
jgi:hypothetical protein